MRLLPVVESSNAIASALSTETRAEFPVVYFVMSLSSLSIVVALQAMSVSVCSSVHPRLPILGRTPAPQLALLSLPRVSSPTVSTHT